MCWAVPCHCLGCLTTLISSVLAAGSVVCPVELRNTGNMRLDNITVSGDTNDCKVSLLEPNKAVSCSLSYKLSQNDFDVGLVVLTATGASATPRGPQPDLPTVPGDSATVALNQSASLDLSAKSDKGYAAAAGDSVLVTFTAGNTGSVTLTNASFSISPALANISCSGSAGDHAVMLAAGDSVQLPSLDVDGVLVCSGSFVFDQDMLEAADQLVLVDGTAAAGSMRISASSQQVRVAPINTPCLVVELLVQNCSLPQSAGGSAECPISIYNRGNVRLYDVSVDVAASCAVAKLQPGNQHTCQLLQAISQSDFDAADESSTLVQVSVTAIATPAGHNNTEVVETVDQQLALQSVIYPAATLEQLTVNPAEVKKAGVLTCYVIPVVWVLHTLHLSHVMPSPTVCQQHAADTILAAAVDAMMCCLGVS